jgi:hypothetical protein
MSTNKHSLVERVFTKLLESSELPPDHVLDDLAAKNLDDLDEEEFKRGDWTPALDDKVRVRSTDGVETDIDDREIPEGKTGRIINNLVAYKIQFSGDDKSDAETRWVTKAMIEPV